MGSIQRLLSGVSPATTFLQRLQFLQERLDPPGAPTRSPATKRALLSAGQLWSCSPVPGTVSDSRGILVLQKHTVSCDRGIHKPVITVMTQ